MSTTSIYNAAAFDGSLANDWHPFAPAVSILTWAQAADYSGTAHGTIGDFFGGYFNNFGFSLALISGIAVPAGATIDSVVLFARGHTTGTFKFLVDGVVVGGNQSTVGTHGITSLDVTSSGTWNPTTLLTRKVGAVTNADGGVSLDAFWVEVTWHQLSLTSIAPASGSVAGGTSVTLTGVGFTGATSVTFGGVAATSLVVVSDVSITCLTPPSVGAGAVDVVVTV